MTRSIRDSKLDTVSGRAKLAAAPDPYWLPMAKNQSIGYRKPKKGAGTWQARLYWPESGTFTKKALGAADDFQSFDGVTVLSWEQAQAAAEVWFKTQAQEAHQEALGEPVAGGSYTVGKALDDYFADGERRGMKGLSRDMQRAAAWITPELGAVEVAKLTRTRLESWLTKVADSPRRLRTKLNAEQSFAKAPKTSDEKRARKDSANRILTVLKAALNHALDRRRVTGGEAWQAVKPYRGTTSARVRFLSQEDQVRLVNACQPDFRRLVTAALHTGARYGELARLQVKDFNAEAGTVFIAESKSGKPRHVVLTEEGQALFTELTAGKPAGDLVLQRDEVKRRSHKETGTGWGHGDAGRLMAEACEAAGLDALNFHELRHSYASMLVNAGCPLPYVAAQLGHSDTRMTEKHYGHLAPSALADAIRAAMPKLGLLVGSKVEPLKIAGGER